MRGGARRFDGVRLGLLVEVDPDTGGSHAVGRLGFSDVWHWDHPLVWIQQVIQLHHGQKLLQLSNIHNITLDKPELSCSIEIREHLATNNKKH